MKVNPLLMFFVLAFCLSVPLAAQTSRRKAKPARKAASAKPAPQPVGPVSEEERQAAENGRIAPTELRRKLDAKEDLVIIDTRDGKSWIGSAVKIPGSLHITLTQLPDRLQELPPDKEIVTYCT